MRLLKKLGFKSLWLVVTLAAAGTLVAVAAVPRARITTRSPEARAAYTEGWTAWRTMRFGVATERFEKAIDLDPHFGLALARLAALYMSSGKVKEGKALYDRARVELPRLSGLERLRIEAFGARIDGQNEREREILEKIRRRYPRDTESIFGLHRLAYLAGDTDKAIEYMREVIAIDPGNFLVYNQLGYMLAELGRWDEATDAFQRYAFISADEANPHDSLGELYERLGRYPEALREYERALAIEPSFTWAKMHRGRTLEALGRNAEARQVFHADSSEVDDHLLLGVMRGAEIANLVECGRLEEARRELETLDRMLPDPLLRSTSQAEFWAAEGDARSIDSLLADLLRRKEDWAIGAEQDTSKVVELALLRTFSAEAKQDWSGATSQIERFLAYPFLGWAERDWAAVQRCEYLDHAGRADDIVAASDSLLARNPRHGRAAYWRARGLERLGRMDEATAAWATVADIYASADPDCRSLRDSRERLLSQTLP